MSETLTKAELAAVLRAATTNIIDKLDVSELGLVKAMSAIADQFDPPKPEPQFKPGDVVVNAFGWIRVVNADGKLDQPDGELSKQPDINSGISVARDRDILAYYAGRKRWLPCDFRHLAEKAYREPCK